MNESTLVKVTGEGQMAIPLTLQKSLGIAPGDYIVMRPMLGGLLISKASEKTHQKDTPDNRIKKAQVKVSFFEAKYNMSYKQFYNYVTTDETFLEKLEITNPTWEVDFNAWEYYVEELTEWNG